MTELFWGLKLSLLLQSVIKKSFIKKGIIWQNPKQSSAKQQPPTPNFKIRAVRQNATLKLILAALLKYWFNDLLPYYWRTCSNVFRQTRKQLRTGREAVTAGVWRGEASLCYVTMPVVDMLHANAWGFSTSQWLVPRNGHSAFSSPWWNHWWQNDKINRTVNCDCDLIWSEVPTDERCCVVWWLCAREIVRFF